MAGIDDSKPFKALNIAIATVSDTRTEEDDTSGDLLAERVQTAGHNVVARTILREDPPKMVTQLREWIRDPRIDVIITSGGTGLTGRDSTPEVYAEVCEKEIPGFGELFRHISLSSIGTSTVQSRATAGVADGTYLFALPGSNGAVKDGWDQILVYQLDIRHRPCNFAELIPRLKET